MTYRCVASAVLGVILYLFYFWRFLPYSQRDRPEHQPNWWSFMIILLVAGLVLTLGARRGRFWIPTCLLLTLFAANIVMIVVDCIPDPTNHNLWPFEFVMITVLAIPAYIGACAAAGIDRFRARLSRRRRPVAST